MQRLCEPCANFDVAHSAFHCMIREFVTQDCPLSRCARDDGSLLLLIAQCIMIARMP